MVTWAHASLPLKQRVDWFSHFAGLTLLTNTQAVIQTDRQTDRQTMLH